MEYIREWWDVVWQWLLGAWQWLLEVWQWLLALPWGVWFDSVRATVGGGMATLSGGMIAVRGFLGSADGWDILGNVATVLATIWLMSLGREFVAQSRLTILSGLYARMEEVHRKIMNLQNLQKKDQIQASDFDDLMSLRNDMKNYFHDNRFMFSQNLQVLKELENAVGDYGNNFKDHEKTHIQYKRLRGMLEQLIHQRNVIERFFYFLFIGVWVSIWRWLRQPKSTRKPT